MPNSYCRNKYVTKIIPFEAIFKLLKQELKQYALPIVTREKKGVEHTPYTTLISCILSLRTKDDVTAKAAIKLLTKYSTPEQMITAYEEEIAALIFPVGFYKTKAKRIKEMSKTILKDYNGRVPDTLEGLLTLNGVGRKTANIVMVYGHKHHGYLPIDTHCHRIPNRLGWIKTDTPDYTEIALKKILPCKYWDDFNHLFVRFGQIICVPISPFCSKCPIQIYCKKVSVKNNR